MWCLLYTGMFWNSILARNEGLFLVLVRNELIWTATNIVLALPLNFYPFIRLLFGMGHNGLQAGIFLM